MNGKRFIIKQVSCPADKLQTIHKTETGLTRSEIKCQHRSGIRAKLLRTDKTDWMQVRYN